MPRILAGDCGEFASPLAGHHGVEADIAVFGFRDDLLRDDDDVAVPCSDFRCAKSGLDDRADIVARLHQRHIGQSGVSDRLGHRRIRVMVPI
jgi:hypothetical protein